MIFCWILSDSKSPDFSWTLLSILADLNNVVVCMISILHLISSSINFFTSPWRLLPARQILFDTMFHSIFTFLAKSNYLSLSLPSRSIYGPMEQQNRPDDKFFFSGLVWSSSWNFMIPLYLKVPEKIKGFIFWNKLLFVCLFVCWLVGFYGISTFVGYSTPNPFLCE